MSFLSCPSLKWSPISLLYLVATKLLRTGFMSWLGTIPILGGQFCIAFSIGAPFKSNHESISLSYIKLVFGTKLWLYPTNRFYRRFFAKDLYYRISTQTEIITSEYPHGIIGFQHNACPALEEVEESSSSHVSSASDANENTLCESSDERNVVTVIAQNHVGSDDPATVYFDVSQHSSTNNIHDI